MPLSEFWLELADRVSEIGLSLFGEIDNHPQIVMCKLCVLPLTHLGTLWCGLASICRQGWCTRDLGGGKSPHTCHGSHYANTGPWGPRYNSVSALYLHVPQSGRNVHLHLGRSAVSGSCRSQPSIRATTHPSPTEGHNQGCLPSLARIRRQKHTSRRYQRRHLQPCPQRRMVLPPAAKHAPAQAGRVAPVRSIGKGIMKG